MSLQEAFRQRDGSRRRYLISIGKRFRKALAGLVILGQLGAGVAQAQVVNELAKLLASDGAAEDFFGSSVAVSGDTAVVGAVGDGDNGSAYVFVRGSGGAWTQQQSSAAPAAETATTCP
jgi:hypothetical protein